VSPEIMYLKDGVNGFIVPKDDIKELYEKIRVLLEDDEMRKRFSGEARREIMMKGHIDNMCKGFLDAIQFACKKRFGVCC
jgi:glycosyltransferase involved in cell wall biosynthesis